MTGFDAESFLKNLTTRPGVYQMYGAEGDLLYVGKAKNLKNRVTSYFVPAGSRLKPWRLLIEFRTLRSR